MADNNPQPYSVISNILRSIIDGSEYNGPADSRIAQLLLELKALIESMPEPMVLKGTLGTGPDDVPDLPNNPTVGDVYVVAEDGTYNEQPAHVGDMFVFFSDETWHYIATGDVDTWRNIIINGIEIQSITNKDPLKFKDGSNVTITYDDNDKSVEISSDQIDDSAPSLTKTFSSDKIISLLDTKVYGFHIDSSEDDPEACITYLEQAVGMNPCYMDYANDKFIWGSWKDAFFMPRPCMLKPDGIVDFYLDPDDFTKREDGTPSHIDHLGNIETSATAAAAYAIDDYLVYDGKLWTVTAAIAIGDTLADGMNITEVANAPDVNDNAMIQWGKDGKKIWYKIVPDTNDATSASIYISDKQVDSEYRAWSFYNYNGEMVDHFYTPCYNGSLDVNGKLRSISGMTYDKLCQSKTVAQEVTAAELNNVTGKKNWYIEQFCDYVLIDFLLILISKSLNVQKSFGNGRINQASAASSMLGTGTMNTKGMFWGSNGNNYGVKVFGMENLWANQWRRYAGHIMIEYQQVYKMTRSTADGTTISDYNQTGSDYLQGGVGPSSNGYFSKVLFNKDGWFANSITDGGDSKYWCDYYYQNSGTRFAVRGGNCNYSAHCGRYVGLHYRATDTSWGIGCAVSFK